MCNILIVDVGTSSMRGILYDETGTKLYKSQQKYFPIYMNNGWVEQDPNDWKDALIKIINEIVEKTKIDNIFKRV
jgi:glycerol kinase